MTHTSLPRAMIVLSLFVFVHISHASTPQANIPVSIQRFLSRLPVSKNTLETTLSLQPLDKKWLHTLRRQDLRLLRNTLFALQGGRFRSEDLQQFFKKQSWYKSNKRAVHITLTGTAKANLKTLLTFEATALQGSLFHSIASLESVGGVSTTMSKACRQRLFQAVQNSLAKSTHKIHLAGLPKVLYTKDKQGVLWAMARATHFIDKSGIWTPQKGLILMKGSCEKWSLIHQGYTCPTSHLPQELRRRHPNPNCTRQVADSQPMFAWVGFAILLLGVGGFFIRRAFSTPNSNALEEPIETEKTEDTEDTNHESVVITRVFDAKMRHPHPIQAEESSPEGLAEQFGLNKTSSQTLHLYLSGQSVEDIAQTRELAESTIKNHLKQALECGALEIQQVLLLRQEEYRRIKVVWDSLGARKKLNPAYKELDGAFDYDVLGFVFAALKHHPNALPI
ncbi:MAG: hypothetical protein CL920_03755 [Deltaproteobacteria bacterium]|nr:hypothetical protein [Deltaproteobacteria bacterium]